MMTTYSTLIPAPTSPYILVGSSYYIVILFNIRKNRYRIPNHVHVWHCLCWTYHSHHHNAFIFSFWRATAWFPRSDLYLLQHYYHHQHQYPHPVHYHLVRHNLSTTKYCYLHIIIIIIIIILSSFALSDTCKRLSIMVVVALVSLVAVPVIPAAVVDVATSVLASFIDV